MRDPNKKEEYKKRISASRVALDEVRRQVKLAKEKEADDRREAFEKEHEELLTWLRGKVYGEPEGYGYNFLNNMAGVANTAAFFSEKQLDAIKKIKTVDDENSVARMNSKHVGNIGDVIELNVKVKRVKSFISSQQYGSGLVYVVKMQDENLNSFVSMSSKFIPEEGATLKISAKVKKHTVYKDENETMINYIKIIS